MIRAHIRRPAALVLALTAALSAGCTQQAADTGGSSSQKPAESKSRTARARSAAAAEVKALGRPHRLPHKKVGFLQLNAQAEVAARIEKGAKDAAAAIGWDFVSCDSQGNPSKMASCGSSLLNQGSDVILSVAIEPAAVTAQMRRARAEGIPWIGVGGAATPNPLFTAQYAPHETEMASLIDTYVFDQLPKRNKAKSSIAMSTFSSVRAGKARSDALIGAVRERPTIRIVDTHEDDLANQIEDARSWATTMLTEHPDVDAVLGTADYSLPVTAAVVAAKFPGKKYPDRPLVVGYLDDLINLDAIRRGQADALATMRLDTESWIAVDQAAEFFSRKKPFSPGAYADSAHVYGLTFNDAVLITKDNLPGKGRYVEPKEDFTTFFTDKWAAEFKAGG
ncbi:sugar ABC transporter substrate-binding protein [Streptomyces sp. NPDC001177]